MEIKLQKGHVIEVQYLLEPCSNVNGRRTLVQIINGHLSISLVKHHTALQTLLESVSWNPRHNL